MSIVFFGTPDFAAPSLRRLVESSIEVSAVVTQPDRPAGRGQKLSPSPIKVVAQELGLPIFQPQSLKSLRVEGGNLRGEKSSAALAEFLEAKQPLASLVIAYGKLIPRSLLEFTEFGVLNIHPSLLPRWRGAAPIQRALFTGDRTTGVSLMQLDEGLDTGPVFCAESLSIEEDDNLGSLSQKLSELSGDMLLSYLPKIFSGELIAERQLEEGVTYAEKWEKSDTEIVWSEASLKTERRIKTCSPHPGAKTNFQENILKVFSAKAVADKNYGDSSPGVVVEANRAEIVVACGDGGFLSLEELQLPGKKRLKIEDFQAGAQIKRGDSFR